MFSRSLKSFSVFPGGGDRTRVRKKFEHPGNASPSVPYHRLWWPGWCVRPHGRIGELFGEGQGEPAPGGKLLMDGAWPSSRGLTHHPPQSRTARGSGVMESPGKYACNDLTSDINAITQRISSASNASVRTSDQSRSAPIGFSRSLWDKKPFQRGRNGELEAREHFLQRGCQCSRAFARSAPLICAATTSSSPISYSNAALIGPIRCTRFRCRPRRHPGFRIRRGDRRGPEGRIRQANDKPLSPVAPSSSTLENARMRLARPRLLLGLIATDIDDLTSKRVTTWRWPPLRTIPISSLSSIHSSDWRLAKISRLSAPSPKIATSFLREEPDIGGRRWLQAKRE